MEIQTSLWEIPVNPSDIVYTPDHVAKNIIQTVEMEKEADIDNKHEEIRTGRHL